MGKWESILRNRWYETVARECYNGSFPLEVRVKLASFLEAREKWILSIADPKNPSHVPVIFEFHQEMLDAYQRLPTNFPPVNPDCAESFLVHRYLTEQQTRIINTLRSNISQLDFFHDLKKSLAEENEVIRRLQKACNAAVSAVGGERGSPPAPKLTEKQIFQQLDETLLQKIGTLKDKRLPKLEENLKYVEEKYPGPPDPNGVVPQYPGNGATSTASNGNSPVLTMQAQLNQLSSFVRNFYPEVFQCFFDLKELAEMIFTEVQQFKDEQRLVALGKRQVRDLNKIDNWWGLLCDCLSSLAEAIQSLLFYCQNLCFDLYDNLLSLQRQVHTLRQKFIQNSLVIEIQPKQVIRSNTFFGHPVKLRVLRCSNNMCIQGGVEQVLLYVDDAPKILQEGGVIPEKKKAGSVNCKKTSLPKINARTVLYKDLKVVEPKRTTKRGEQLVVEEKFCILFRCKVKADGNDYQLSAASIRLSITTHPNQEGHAWGVIIWENALDNMKRRGSFLSEVKSPSHYSSGSGSTGPEYDDVTWDSLIQSVDYLFQSLGKGLSETNKAYLKKKLFRGSIPPCGMVNWRLFTKDAFVEVSTELLDMKDREDIIKEEKENAKKKEVNAKKTKIFTFWEWLYACFELLTWKPKDTMSMEHSLKIMWERGLIEGFMEESEMRRLLLNATHSGTFFIRFPEGRPESIGIYVIKANGELHKLTYPRAELERKPIQERIRHNDLLTHLYPDIHKKQAFPSNSAESAIINGYQRRIELREYFPKPKAPPSISSYDQGVPSPASSHSFYSYRSQLTQPVSEGSPSQGGQCQNGGNTTSSGETCTTMNMVLPDPNEMDFSFGEDSITQGIQSWLEGVTPSVLTWT